MFKIISVVFCAKSEGRIPDTKKNICIPVSADAAAAGTPNSIKQLLANGISASMTCQFLVTAQEVYENSLLIAQLRQLSF